MIRQLIVNRSCWGSAQHREDRKPLSWPDFPELPKLEQPNLRWSLSNDSRHTFPHAITSTVIMMLRRVRVKAGSAEAMEMNGHVNREVDWGAEAPLVAWCATFFPHSSAQRTKRGYLSHSEISNRAAIHHWLTCYWSPVHPLFSTKLYYKKKRITNVCTVWVVHVFSCLSRRLRKGKNMPFRVALERHVKQPHSKRLALLFSRWQAWNRFKSTLALKLRKFQPVLLVVHRWHLSEKCCMLFPCPKQYGVEHADISIDL